MLSANNINTLAFHNFNFLSLCLLGSAANISFEQITCFRSSVQIKPMLPSTHLTRGFKNRIVFTCVRVPKFNFFFCSLLKASFLFPSLALPRRALIGRSGCQSLWGGA